MSIPTVRITTQKKQPSFEKRKLSLCYDQENFIFSYPMLNYFFFDQIGESLLALVIGLIVVFLLSKIFRRRRLNRFFKLRYVILVLQLITTFTLLTNPLQNYNLILIGSILLYYISRYAPQIVRSLSSSRKTKPKPHQKGRLRRLVLLAYFVIIGVFAKADLLDSGRLPSQEKVQLQEDIILYDTYESGVYDQALLDTNGNQIFDTIKYDSNKDGKTDIIHYDKDEDQIIDDREILDYKSQQYVILLTLILLVGLVFFLNSSTRKKVSQTAIIATLLILTSSYQITPSVVAQNIGDLQQDILRYQSCAQDPFNASQCQGVPAESILFFKHLANPEFRRDFENLANKWIDCQISACNEQAINSLTQQTQSLRDKWMNIAPTSPTNTVEDTPDPDQSDTQEGVETTEENIEEQTDSGNEEDPIDSDTQEEEESYEDTQDQPEEEYVVIDEEKQEDTEQEKPTEKKPAKDDSKDIYKEIVDDQKAFVDITNGTLTSINTIADFQDFKRDQKIISENIDQTKGKIDNLLGKNGLKVDDIVEDLAKKVTHLEGQSQKGFGSRLKDTQPQGKFNTTMKGIGALGSTMDAYLDYKDFNKKFKGDADKTLVATTATSIGKNILGANPIDMTMGAVTGILKLSGQDKRAEQTEKFQAGEITKQIIIDGYDTDIDSAHRVREEQTKQVLGARTQSNYSSVEKVGITLNALATTSYGYAAVGVGASLEIAQDGVKAFKDGVKQISSWLSI